MMWSLRHSLAVLVAVVLVAATGWSMRMMAHGQSGSGMQSVTIRSGSPAVVDVTFQSSKPAASVLVDLAVSVRSVSGAGSLLLHVDLFDPAELQRYGAKAKPVASGQVAFFPPAVVGQQRQFTTALVARDSSAIAAKSSVAVVSLRAANPATVLGNDEMNLDRIAVR